MVYDKNNFRKLQKCFRKTNPNGECVYYDTCYGIHKIIKQDEVDVEKLKENYEKLKQKYLDLKKICINLKSENDSNTKENEEIKKFLKCRNCFKYQESLAFVFLTLCENHICNKCFKDTYENTKKKALPKCPICQKGIEKKTLFVIDFKAENTNNETTIQENQENSQSE